MEGVLCTVITVFIVILFARVVMSWFPMPPGSFSRQIYDGLMFLTDWALVPLRNLIPPIGMIDISVMVLGFFLIILQQAICG